MSKKKKKKKEGWSGAAVLKEPERRGEQKASICEQHAHTPLQSHKSLPFSAMQNCIPHGQAQGWLRRAPHEWPVHRSYGRST